VRYLIERGAQQTLHLACQLGDLDMAREVLDQDPDQVNFVPQEPHLLAGSPAQHIALWGGHADIIRLLAEARTLGSLAALSPMSKTPRIFSISWL
jgi:hypothetical protein